MKLIAPDYYLQFRCIADRCRHSCCIGWEIDVDEDTREMYRHVPGAFGERLNAAIEDGETVSFRLDPDERCPMLNANGLCDLITELGEEALCQICADHPRFRSFFSDRIEIGLGLCCEAAAALVLGHEEPVRLLTLEDDGNAEPLPGDEAELLSLRDHLTVLMQDRTRTVHARLESLQEAIGCRMPVRKLSEWVSIYRSLERLDPAWDTALDSIIPGLPVPENLSTAYEQFCVYLLYRHLPGAIEDGDAEGRVLLCVLSTAMLMLLCAAHQRRSGECTLADCVEYARMYSAEIEYSEDNIAALLDALA